MNKPKPNTYGALTRSTEEEFKAFRKMLDQYTFTPEKLNRFLADYINKSKTPKKEI